MKKHFLITLIFVFLWQLHRAYGQDSGFAFGLEVGPSRTWSHGTEGLRSFTEPATRVFRGVSLQYNFNSVFSLRTGQAYETKGHVMKFLAVDNNGQPIGNATATAKFSYLTIPLLLRTTFGKKPGFFVNAGPFVGLQLRHNVTVEVPGRPTLEEDHSQTFKPIDLGITAGAGLTFPVLPQLELSFEIRNNLGLMDIDKIQPAEVGPYRTNSLNFLLGLAYRPGGGL